MRVQGVDHIALIGVGMIGSSLATLFTGNGYKTTLYARSDKSAEKGVTQYRKFFDTLVEKELVTRDQVGKCENYLHTTTSWDDIADADVVFECVPEEMEMKHEVYAEVEKHCPQVRAIASTTSGKAPDDLAKGCSQYKDRIMVAHPFFPPHLIPFIEIVKGEVTTDESVKLVYDLMESCGRKPVIANRALPGFVANRLQHALVREAGYLVDEGIATPEDVDRALMYSFAPRYSVVGLFQHQDAAGLDMVKRIQDYVVPSLSRKMETPDFINTRYNKGELGMKTGKGIYDWPEEKQQEFHRKAAEPYFRFFNWDIPD